MCLAFVMCVFITAHPVHPSVGENFYSYPFLRLSPYMYIFHVWESLRKYKFPISLQYILNPDTPRPPQMLGLATVKSFVCGGGLASCHMYLRPSVCHIDRRMFYILPTLQAPVVPLVKYSCNCASNTCRHPFVHHTYIYPLGAMCLDVHCTSTLI